MNIYAILAIAIFLMVMVPMATLPIWAEKDPKKYREAGLPSPQEY